MKTIKAFGIVPQTILGLYEQESIRGRDWASDFFAGQPFSFYRAGS